MCETAQGQRFAESVSVSVSGAYAPGRSSPRAPKPGPRGPYKKHDSGIQTEAVPAQTNFDEHSGNILCWHMSNSLTRLLETPSGMRTVEDYERTFDDFIAFAGGRRLEEAVDILPGVLNADYLLETEVIDLVVELKQVNAYVRVNSVDRYFEKLLNQRQIRNPTQISATQILMRRTV